MERLKKYHGEKAAWVLQTWTQTWQSEAVHDWSLESAIHAISCPTLAIHGELDEYRSQRHAQRIGTLAGDLAQVLLIENCDICRIESAKSWFSRPSQVSSLNDGLLL